MVGSSRNRTSGYDDVRRGATREQITESLQVDVASLADVIRSKEAVGREKDRAVLPILRQVLERSRSIGYEGPEIGFLWHVGEDPCAFVELVGLWRSG